MIFAPKSLYIGGDYALTKNKAATVVVSRSEDDIYTIRGVKVTQPHSGRRYIDLETEHRDLIEGLWKQGLVGTVAVDRSGIYPWLSRWEKMGLPAHAIDTGAITMSQVTEFFLDLVKHRRIRHNGDPTLRTHMGNSRLKDTNDGRTMISKGRAGRLDNDAAIATLLALFIAEKEAFVPAKSTLTIGNIFYSGEADQYPLTQDGRGQYDGSAGIWLPERGHHTSHVGYIKGRQSENNKGHKFSTCAGRRHGTCKLCTDFIDSMTRRMDIDAETAFVHALMQGDYDYEQ